MPIDELIAILRRAKAEGAKKVVCLDSTGYRANPDPWKYDSLEALDLSGDFGEILTI